MRSVFISSSQTVWETVEPPPVEEVPSMPTGLVTSPLSIGEGIRLMWNPNTAGDNVTQYKIYRAPGLGGSFGSSSLLNTVSSVTLTYDDEGLAEGTSWTYFIIAVNVVGDSVPSVGHDATVLPPAAQINFIKTVPNLGFSDNASLFIGMKFTVGPANIKIISLGRWKTSGNSGMHLLKMVNAWPDQSNVPNVFTKVDLSIGSANTFVYNDLNTPMVLEAGKSYYLVSQEVAGGDSWHQLSGTFGYSADVTLNSGVYGYVTDPAYFENGTTGQMYGPLDFTYQVTGDSATSSFVGSVYPNQIPHIFPNQWAFVTSNNVAWNYGVGSFVGTVDLRLSWRGGSPGSTWSGVFQYYYDDSIPIGSPVHDSGIASSFVSSWDTTNVPDGTHVIWGRFIDTVGVSSYNIPLIGTVVVVHNHGFINGPQDVWAVAGHQNEHRFGGLPDKLHYDGNACPANNSYLPNIQPVNVPPATADARYSSNPALLRDHYKFVVSMSRAICAEWEGFYRWGALSTDLPGGTLGTGGGVFAWVEDVHRNGLDASEQISRWAFNGLGFDGNRFNNFVQGGWATYVEAPAHDGWLGVDIGGRLFHETWNGDVTTIAGPRQDRSKGPVWIDIDLELLGDDEKLHDVIANAGEIVGTFDAGITGEWMLGATDLCVDPRDTNIIYVASEYLNVIFKVNRNSSPAHVSLYAGALEQFGYVDVSNSSGATNARFSICRSICMANDGTMYVADGADLFGAIAPSSNNLIRVISPNGLNVSTLCGQPGLPNSADAVNDSLIDTYSPRNKTPISFSNPACYISLPRFIRWANPGKTQIVVLEANYFHMRRIDLTNKTVTYIGRALDPYLSPNYAEGGQWIQFDVDRYGTCGPPGDIIVNNPLVGNADWRMSADGSYGANWAGDTGVNGPVLVGRLGGGHYGWTISIADTQGRMVMGGTLSVASQQFRIAQATGGDLDILNGVNQVNGNVLDRGYYTFIFGAAKGWPINCRPSLHILLSRTGQNQIGTPTFDDLNATYTTSAAMAGFFQAGAGGNFPRPELTGKDMDDVEYLVRRLSFAGSYPPSVTPVAPDPLYGLWYPIVTSISATRLNSTSIQVNWTTDKPTIGMAVACTDVQFAMGSITSGVYNVFSPIENLTASTYATSHSAVIVGLSPNHTIHYNVLVKDLIGNFAHTADHTIAPAMSANGDFINGAGSLVTAYGKWTFGAEHGPRPGWGGGPFHQVLLNGQPVGPSLIFGGWQKLMVFNGGNLYAMTYDQLWYFWGGGQWQPVDGIDYASGPASTPTPPPLPDIFVGPYAVSADGTAISGGTGSVTTLDGVWTFGTANGAGWNMKRNGQPMAYNDSPTGNYIPIPVTNMQVNSHGRLFFRTTDTLWHVWAANQPNACVVGSIGQPIPVDIQFTPSRAVIGANDPVGTFITKMSVTMSDGTVFAGTTSVGADFEQSAISSGLTITKNLASLEAVPRIFPVKATQNGSNFVALFDMQVIP